MGLSLAALAGCSGSRHITIGFVLDRGDPCTDDLVPMTHTFALPETAGTHPTTVVVTWPGERADVVVYLG